MAIKVFLTREVITQAIIYILKITLTILAFCNGG